MNRILGSFVKLKVIQSNIRRDEGKRVDCTSGRARIILVLRD